MMLPSFVKKNLKPFQCRRCRQTVKPSEEIAIEGAIRKRPQMAEPHFYATVECPYCGEQSGLGLMVPIPWPEVVNWLLELATGHHRPELPNGLIAANDIPKDQRVWLKVNDQMWMFRLVGGYRKGSVTYLLVRRIPMQPAGWDGRVWDGVLRVRRDRSAEIVTEDDPMHLPLDNWDDFAQLPEGGEFRIGGGTWTKLSSSTLRKLSNGGTLLAKA